jgi:hypothetical protein
MVPSFCLANFAFVVAAPAQARQDWALWGPRSGSAPGLRQCGVDAIFRLPTLTASFAYAHSPQGGLTRSAPPALHSGAFTQLRRSRSHFRERFSSAAKETPETENLTVPRHR